MHLKTMNPEKDHGRQVEVQFGGGKLERGYVNAISDTGFEFQKADSDGQEGTKHFISFIWADTWRWPKPSEVAEVHQQDARLETHKRRAPAWREMIAARPLQSLAAAGAA